MNAVLLPTSGSKSPLHSSTSLFIDLLSEKTIKQNDHDDDDDDDNLKFMEITLVADRDTVLYHGDDTATHLLMLANLVRV